MGNAVTFFEIGAADNASLKEFYSSLFGWRMQEISGGYNLIDTCAGGGLGGGLGRSRDGTPWATFYVEADDVQQLLDRAEGLGGKIVVPPTEIPNMLTWAMFTDPDGLLVGLYKPAQAFPSSSDGQGAAVDWFEVLGSKAQRTLNFYSILFGWQASGPGPYWLIDTGAGRGIQGGAGAGGGSKWATVYANVPDVEETLARAEQLGGRREYGPNQVDDHRRTGALRDPAGNVFGVYDHKH
jgi:uncharacterized protein